MTIDKETRAEILRLYHVEKWTARARHLRPAHHQVPLTILLPSHRHRQIPLQIREPENQTAPT